MAKLNGVKSVSESITYSGVTYMQSDAEAVVGDIIRYDDDRSYVTEGGYYEVTHMDYVDDPQITDDDGDDFDLCGEEYTVYKAVKSAASPQPQYNEVKRKAAVGERINIVDACCSFGDYDNGTEMTVEKLKREGVGVFPYNDRPAPCLYILDTEYVVLEPIAGVVKTPVPLKVGDYAKITEFVCGHDVGTIGIVTEVKDPRGYANRVEVNANDKTRAERNVVPATPEEIAAATAEDVKQAKWAAIGRKVGEFKAGDVVRVLTNHPQASVLKAGDIGVVGELDFEGGSSLVRFRVNAPGREDFANWVQPESVKLIATAI